MHYFKSGWVIWDGSVVINRTLDSFSGSFDIAHYSAGLVSQSPYIDVGATSTTLIDHIYDSSFTRFITISYTFVVITPEMESLHPFLFVASKSDRIVFVIGWSIDSFILCDYDHTLSGNELHLANLRYPRAKWFCRNNHICLWSKNSMT